MNRIDRLHAILVTLQSRRVVRAEDLAMKFEVSLRTVYRDIRALEEGGVPICAEAGIGYYIMKGYHLPPVMFTKDEARSLLMAGKILEKNSDASVSEHFQGALTKVRAVLNDEIKEELEDLEEHIVVNPFGWSQPTVTENPVLLLIKSALSSQYTIKFDYYANTTGEYTQREVAPLGLVFYNEKWHLIAYCQLRKDYRDFRTDRMSKVLISTERYKYSDHPTLKAYLDTLIQGTELFKAIIRVDHSIYRYLTNTKHMLGFVTETKLDDCYEMEFATHGLDYFARWLLMLDNRVTVVEPESLQTKLQELVRELVQKYLS